MRTLFYLCAVAALVTSLGCCRACCWQRGGSWYNGYCYPQVPPALQPVPAQQTQPYYAAPPTAAPCVCQ